MSSGIEKFINREWISQVQIEAIIKETAASIALRNWRKKNTDAIEIDKIKHSFLHRFLNEAINYAVSFQLLNLNKKQNWNDLKNLSRDFIHYAESIDMLIKIGFPLGNIPQDLRRDAEKLHNGLKQRDGSQRYSGRQAWEAVFYPEALALYRVVFGEEPKATANTASGHQPGAAIVFLQYIVETVHDAQCELGFAEHFQEHSNNPVIWKFPSPDSLRVNIHKWKKYPLEVDEEEKAWRVNVRFYEEFL